MVDLQSVLKTRLGKIVAIWLSLLTITVIVLLARNIYGKHNLSVVPAQADNTIKLENEIKELRKTVNQYKKEVKDFEKVLYYVNKLGDKDFTGTYGHDYVWYTAAEELGKIGKASIPYLIENLNTKNSYERAVTFYALMLASQHENVKEFTNGEYIETPLEFNAKKHPEMRKKAEAWWEKYKNNWE